ncbi:unnamed protein product [Pedinophyceae sp. YPF-701]|nr:unnamed protein product [Pedinophyceae sp. YPF-701]
MIGACVTALSAAIPAAARAATTAAPSAANLVASIAAEAAVANGADTAWVLTSTALVLFMTLPGLAIFYAGLVKQRNAISLLMQTFSIAAVMTVLWTVCGYSLSFSEVGMVEGKVGLHSFIGGLDKCFFRGITEHSLTGTIPELLWAAFQMTFAIITPALMVGAWAERMKYAPKMIFIVLWSFLVYFPAAHSVWGGPGAYFADMGVLDFAGGIVVHVTAGIGALLACIMVGPRRDNAMKPHNLPLMAMGTGMLWVGWYGFNAGSAVTAGGAAAMALLVTQISAATAACVWSAVDWVTEGKPSMLGLGTGAIAGLASITPASGFVGPVGALIIGATAGLVCRFFSFEIKEKFGYDDSLDVFGVHGVGGFVGTLLVGFLCHPMFGGNQVGVNMLHQFGVQAFAAFSTAAYTLVASYVCLKIAGALCGGLRATAEEEESGLDSSMHGEEAYSIMSMDEDKPMTA